MKHHHIVLGSILLIGMSAVSLTTLFAEKATVVRASETATSTEATTTPALNHEQQVWASTVNWCESRGNDNAINPKDADGTPSYGRYQFKLGTFLEYAVKYHVITLPPSDQPQLVKLSNGSLGSTYDAMMDGNYQQEVFNDMILDPSISMKQWRHQLYPDCVRRFGLPPQST